MKYGCGLQRGWALNTLNGEKESQSSTEASVHAERLNEADPAAGEQVRGCLGRPWRGMACHWEQAQTSFSGTKRVCANSSTAL